MRERVILDLNSIAHAAHRGTILKAGDQEVQAIYNSLKTIRSIRVRHPNATIVGLWDGRSWRRDQSTVYKANREDTPEKVEERRRYKTQTPFLRKGLRLLGVPQLFAANLEADDLAGFLARKYVERGDAVRLVTGDQDWLQLIDNRVVWEDHRDEAKKVSTRSFQEWTGCSDTTQFVQLKALGGDTSDNLPGVGGVGEVNGRLILKVWGRVEAFLADKTPEATWDLKAPQKLNKAGVMVTPGFPKCLKDFHANKTGGHEKFYHNVLMMDLSSPFIPQPERMTLLKGELDAGQFKSMCHELAFSSIYRDDAFVTFIEPFARKIN